VARKLLFVFATVALVAMLLEGLARVGMQSVEHSADDASWRRVWVREHSNTREIYYEFDVYDPLLGWRARPNLRNRRVFGDEILNTNSLGLRGATEYAIGDPGGRNESGEPNERLRVLVLGDSFTFGDEVSDDETFCHYLSRLLPEVEIMNFGMHGYGHDQMLLLYRELARQYRPDVVVVAFVYADIYRNLLSFRDYAKPRFVLDSGSLRLEGSPVPSPEETLAREPLRSKLLDAIDLAHNVFVTRTGRLESRARELSLAILDNLIDEVQADGGLPLLFYLPAGPEILRQAEDPSDGETFMLAYCEQRGVVCGSARPEFGAAVARGKRFATDRHWGPAGHRAAARAQAALLRAAGVTSASQHP
jgi:hypothetical protein